MGGVRIELKGDDRGDLYERYRDFAEEQGDAWTFSPDPENEEECMEAMERDVTGQWVLEYHQQK